jgi:hypothetical protein
MTLTTCAEAASTVIAVGKLEQRRTHLGTPSAISVDTQDQWHGPTTVLAKETNDGRCVGDGLIRPCPPNTDWKDGGTCSPDLVFFLWLLSDRQSIE